MMTILEIEKFYDNDKKMYILEKNREFLEWLGGNTSKGYIPPVSTVEEMQIFINKVASWYLLKYFTESSLQLKSDTLSNEMTLSALRKRLSHQELGLFDCPYRAGTMSDSKGQIGILIHSLKGDGDKYIQMDASGTVRKGEATLISNVLAAGVNGPFSLLDFVEALKDNKDYDIKEAKRMLWSHKIDLRLRKKILEFIALSIAYSKTLIPALSINVAKIFAQDIEDVLGIKLMDIEALVASNQDKKPEKKSKSK